MAGMIHVAGNLFLVGLMGAGKTTVGRTLARETGKSFYDSDHEIEARAGVRIATIFEIEGEPAFRERERKTIAELAERQNIVLATGGGAVTHPDTRRVLALALAWLAQVPAGDAALLMVLAASASYIAVPAVVRYAIPEADPSLYVSLSLGVTFPLNILVGIPLYTQVVLRLWGG